MRCQSRCDGDEDTIVYNIGKFHGILLYSIALNKFMALSVCHVYSVEKFVDLCWSNTDDMSGHNSGISSQCVTVKISVSCTVGQLYMTNQHRRY